MAIDLNLDGAGITPNPIPVQRTRKRIDSITIDKETIANRIEEFYNNDHNDRKEEIDARLQRYAKFRMWTEGKQWPWPDSTDAAIPDMMTSVMRMEDTLHNAVMSSRPPILSKASKPTDKEKEDTINNLLDFQFFEEQPGENIVGQLAHDFISEGLFTCYTPWIDESRRTRELKIYNPIPPNQQPTDYFLSILTGFFPKGQIKPVKDGWDWQIIDGDKNAKASFFSKDDDRIELDLDREVQVYNGPRAIRKDIQDILHPARCENLQIPSPSNPLGAAHVIMRDFPTIDEITRLQKSGYYDLMTDEEVEKIKISRMDETNQERNQQKDTMQGHIEQRDLPKGAESHKTLTRLMCFDCFDIDGDGLDEDVVFWMILEDKIILKAGYLSQVFPSDPPRRPFAETGLFPVPGRRYAIGILEMMEGLHDLMKQFFDQGGDAGTLANAPFGFYRASGNLKPEVISMEPGMLYPLSDPKNDINMVQMGNQGQAFMFNMTAILQQMEEKLTNIGDLQLGRVPQGKASALRTVSGMQTILSQGDARPERVLRKFFLGLSQIFENFHTLNEVLLPENKQFMITGNIDPRDNPYRLIDNQNEIRGKFRFTFSANVLNTSKEALQQSLNTLMGMYITPLAMQMKIITPDGAYRLLRDTGKAYGQDPDKYITPPTPGAMLPPITVQEAILYIMDGIMPEGTPMEGLDDHFQKLQEFTKSDDFGHLDASHIPLFKAYLEQVGKAVQQEHSQLQMQQAAMQFQGAPGGGMPSAPSPNAPPDNQQAPLQNNELRDESLPSSGGGANTGQP